MSRRPDDIGRRGQLVRESARLFREKGFEGTSVRDIAAATGLQSGSWVYHFKTKQDILAAVMEEGLQQALERIEAIARAGLAPREHFRALLRAHIDTLLGPGQDFIPVLLYEWRSLEAPGRRRVIELQKRYEKVWDDVIGRLQRIGDWAAPTRLDRLFLFGALNWIAQWYRPGGTLDAAQIAAEAERFLLRTPAFTSRRRGSKVAGKSSVRARRVRVNRNG